MFEELKKLNNNHIKGRCYFDDENFINGTRNKTIGIKMINYVKMVFYVAFLI